MHSVHMLARRALHSRSAICRPYCSTRALHRVPALPDATLEAFRNEAFNAKLPALLPRETFNDLPAIREWFVQADGQIRLNGTYLARFGSTIVPLEFSNEDQFSRTEQSLSFFLDASTVTRPTARIYLAQAPIADLPQGLKDDLPTPEVVLKAGKGDIYDSSIWLGEAPTYTPLHRDPNPNLFVQLAGTKVVRLFRPDIGRAIFAKVQERVGGSASATMRGEEMMAGAEKKALEQEVWNSGEGSQFAYTAWEAELSIGDGLFIPKGWWHSVKGTGVGMTGSVNWWFR